MTPFLNLSSREANDSKDNEDTLHYCETSFATPFLSILSRKYLYSICHSGHKGHEMLLFFKKQYHFK